MKVKKEVWVEVCDFCGELKMHTCALCGKDLCNKHTIQISSLIEKDIPFLNIPDIVIENLCFNHLDKDAKAQIDMFIEYVEKYMRTH